MVLIIHAYGRVTTVLPWIMNPKLFSSISPWSQRIRTHQINTDCALQKILPLEHKVYR